MNIINYKTISFFLRKCKLYIIFAKYRYINIAIVISISISPSFPFCVIVGLSFFPLPFFFSPRLGEKPVVAFPQALENISYSGETLKMALTLAVIAVNGDKFPVYNGSLCHQFSLLEA